MSSFSADRSILAAAFCLAALTGCASTNPLIDEPAAASSPAAGQSASGTVTTSKPTGMQRFLGLFTPYRIDIQQGNFVSREMVAQLKEGMQRSEGVTREQARFVLGTPLLTDMFHADRWDYVFRLKKSTGEVIASRVTLFFKGNRLVNIDGDTLPTEQEYLAFIAGTAGK
ncbi:MAG TPA: outer membrane protein assembly factor BamE [Noviherbaspirillum sp.]|nr:outer membrane protein assembly factor BamE [Noviherbaspirillum sp.]